MENQLSEVGAGEKKRRRTPAFKTLVLQNLASATDEELKGECIAALREVERRQYKQKQDTARQKLLNDNAGLQQQVTELTNQVNDLTAKLDEKPKEIKIPDPELTAQFQKEFDALKTENAKLQSANTSFDSLIQALAKLPESGEERAKFAVCSLKQSPEAARTLLPLLGFDATEWIRFHGYEGNASRSQLNSIVTSCQVGDTPFVLYAKGRLAIDYPEPKPEPVAPARRLGATAPPESRPIGWIAEPPPAAHRDNSWLEQRYAADRRR